MEVSYYYSHMNWSNCIYAFTHLLLFLLNISRKWLSSCLFECLDYIYDKQMNVPFSVGTLKNLRHSSSCIQPFYSFSHASVTWQHLPLSWCQRTRVQIQKPLCKHTRGRRNQSNFKGESTLKRFVMLRGGDRHAYIINPTTHLEKLFSVLEKAQYSWFLALTSTLSYLNAESLTALFELISTNRLYICHMNALRLQNSLTLMTGGYRLKEEPDIELCFPCKKIIHRMETWKCASFKSIVTNHSLDLI